MKTIITLFIVLFALTTSAQSYYPAGLGNANLVLWLTAADSTTLLNAAGKHAENGKAVATWVDKSGSGANAVQTASASQPVYATNQLNGFGGVLFQNTSQFLSGISGAYQTIVAVRSMPGTGHYQYLFSSPANQDFSIRGGGASTAYTDGPNSNDWTVNTGSPMTQWMNGIQGLTGNNGNHVLVSSASAPTNSNYSISNVNASAPWGGRGMNGNDPVYELLSYNTTLNTTQRHLLENYEAAEWGLSGSLPTTSYALYTAPTASTFNKNLAGIGYTSATDNFLTNPAGSTDGLGFSSGIAATDFLNTTGFLMAAHNGQANTILVNPIIPGVGSVSSLKQWNRSWNLQATGGNSAGMVTLNFNFADYNGTTPNAAYTYSLLYNATNGAFATGSNQLITTVSTATSGNIVSFKVSVSNLPNGYYTIVYSSGPIVLPVTLTEFKASRQEASSLLTWSVSDGEAIDHFQVERSTDGATFSSVGSVEGLKDGALADNYRYVDNQPASGTNYYRLGMMSTTGLIGYSVIIPVTFDHTTTESVPSIYPNPVTDVMHIHTTTEGAIDIRIFTMGGQLMGSTRNAGNNTGLDVPVSNLRTGIYIVEIQTASGKYVSKMMKS